MKVLICILLSFHCTSIHAIPFKESDTISNLVFGRYGAHDPRLTDAWQILLSLGYKDVDLPFAVAGTEIWSHPSLRKELPADSKMVKPAILSAWDLLAAASTHLIKNRRLNQDFQGLTATVLAMELVTLRSKCAHSLEEKEKRGLRKWAMRYLQTFSDLEKVFPARASSLSKINAQWEALFTYASSCLASRQKYNELAFLSHIAPADPLQLNAPTTDHQVTHDQCWDIYQRNKNALSYND